MPTNLIHIFYQFGGATAIYTAYFFARFFAVFDVRRQRCSFQVCKSHRYQCVGGLVSFLPCKSHRYRREAAAVQFRAMCVTQISA